MSGRMPAARTDVEHVVLDGEAVVYDVAAGTLHHLNASATAVWSRCDGRSAVAKVLTDLAREFDVDVDVIERDVALVIEALVEQGLVTRG